MKIDITLDFLIFLFDTLYETNKRFFFKFTFRYNKYVLYFPRVCWKFKSNRVLIIDYDVTIHTEDERSICGTMSDVRCFSFCLCSLLFKVNSVRPQISRMSYPVTSYRRGVLIDTYGYQSFDSRKINRVVFNVVARRPKVASIFRTFETYFGNFHCSECRISQRAVS